MFTCNKVVYLLVKNESGTNLIVVNSGFYNAYNNIDF